MDLGIAILVWDESCSLEEFRIQTSLLVNTQQYNARHNTRKQSVLHFALIPVSALMYFNHTLARPNLHNFRKCPLAPRATEESSLARPTGKWAICCCQTTHFISTSLCAPIMLKWSTNKVLLTFQCKLIKIKYIWLPVKGSLLVPTLCNLSCKKENK